jgi:hypothetical protein
LVESYRNEEERVAIKTTFKHWLWADAREQKKDKVVEIPSINDTKQFSAWMSRQKL